MPATTPGDRRSRRPFLGTLGAVPLLKGVVPMNKRAHVVVVGAGAFGGWTALYLRRHGARVTLLDAWGPGNSRASSGGETRVIRATYGPRGVYTHLAARALALWKEHERRWRRTLYHPIGVLWLVEDDDQYEQAALPLLQAAGIAFDRLSGAETARRYPQINCERVRWAIFEKEGGYLTARVGCAAVLEGFLAEGGEYRQLAVDPPAPTGGELRAVTLSDGGTLTADLYVFACGPWLGRLFPDPTGERLPTPEALQTARDYLARRFPALKGAPLLEARVCQYENSPDEHFIIDRHPQAANLWLVGGGSGHGFKHGPAVGELVADAVLGRRGPAPTFRLTRF